MYARMYVTVCMYVCYSMYVCVTNPIVSQKQVAYSYFCCNKNSSLHLIIFLWILMLVILWGDLMVWSYGETEAGGIRVRSPHARTRVWARWPGAPSCMYKETGGLGERGGRESPVASRKSCSSVCVCAHARAHTHTHSLSLSPSLSLSQNVGRRQMAKIGRMSSCSKRMTRCRCFYCSKSSKQPSSMCYVLWLTGAASRK